MKLDPVRVARLIALVAWAAFFDWLWLSDEWLNYVGPKTQWVVPFGGIALTLAALLYAPSVRTPEGGMRPTLGELAGLTALVLPILVAFAVPSAGLGALAADRKGNSGDSIALAPPPKDDGQVDFYDLAAAEYDPATAADYGVRENVKVDVLGVVTDPGRENKGFELTRFSTNCCAADAIPHSIRIIPAPDARGATAPSEDSWMRIEGRARRRGDKWEVVASSVEEDEAPEDPYL